MPGPVSDSYDPEWGTAEKAEEIRVALDKVYNRVSEILGKQPPMYIGDLVNAKLYEVVPAILNEKEWRLIRFSLERAKESI